MFKADRLVKLILALFLLTYAIEKYVVAKPPIFDWGYTQSVAIIVAITAILPFVFMWFLRNRFAGLGAHAAAMIVGSVAAQCFGLCRLLVFHHIGTSRRTTSRSIGIARYPPRPIYCCGADLGPLAPMMRFMLKILVAMAAASVLSSAANADRLDALHGLDHTEHLIYQSPSLGRPFDIYVKVPQNQDRGDKKLPVIYLLDGGETFPIIGAYSHYLTFSEEMPDAIIVGISYGTDDPANGNMRVTDFTAPAAENTSYGGAAKFLDMLEREIFPMVERGYPADPDRRTLVGMSLGGQFILYAAIEKPDLFEGLIAVNPALHRNLKHFLDALGQMPPAPKSRQSHLYVVSTEDDDPRFREPALKWIASAKASKNKPWCLYIDELADESHLSGLPRAFRNAMRWMHQEYPACLP